MDRTTKKATLAADREARREAMSLRTTPTMKAALVAAASQSGRSLTQEIEFRLEASFSEDRMRQIIREEIAQAVASRSHIARTITVRGPMGEMTIAPNGSVSLPNMSDADRDEWLRNQ